MIAICSSLASLLRLSRSCLMIISWALVSHLMATSGCLFFDSSFPISKNKSASVSAVDESTTSSPDPSFVSQRSARSSRSCRHACKLFSNADEARGQPRLPELSVRCSNPWISGGCAPGARSGRASPSLLIFLHMQQLSRRLFHPRSAAGVLQVA